MLLHVWKHSTVDSGLQIQIIDGAHETNTTVGRLGGWEQNQMSGDKGE